MTDSCCAPFRYFDIPMEILPSVRSSSEIYGWMVSSDTPHSTLCVCFCDTICVLRSQT